MKSVIGVGFAALLAAGCGQGLQSHLSSSASQIGSEVPQTPGTPTPNPETGLGICSNLDFAGVIWPATFQTMEKRTMALALNITGSYEGNAGWENLANNFDGQGFSLGLNQQNLGQGTLQPMLKKMLDDEQAIAKATFSKANLESMKSMVETWSQSSIVESQSDGALFSRRTALSKFDIGFEPDVLGSASRNSASVSWAVSNVYLKDKTTFKPDWSKSLQTFASTAPFRSLQIGAATEMFGRAVAYFYDLGFSELRSLLLMYDFVVQNGGFNVDHFASFRAFDDANSNASEEVRLLKLLEIRLSSVRPQFRADVDARKRAIIFGKGRVHGRDRDLQQEYCFRVNDNIRTTPFPIRSAVIF